MSTTSSNAGSTVANEQKAKSLGALDGSWLAFAALAGLPIAPEHIPKRVGVNTSGKDAPLTVNVWQVTANETKLAEVFQYRVDMVDGTGNAPEQRRTKDLVWKSNAVRTKLQKGDWMYDGDALAWSIVRFDSFQINVDLNEECGRGPSKPNSKQLFTIQIKPAKALAMQKLFDCINGKDQVMKGGVVAWAECQNVLEHIIHQSPREKMVTVKKSFFNKIDNRAGNTALATHLANGILAYKGTYVSFRSAFMGFKGQTPIRSLTLNVDVSNACFHMGGSLRSLLPHIFTNVGIKDPAQMQNEFRTTFNQIRQRDTNPESPRAIMAFYNTRTGKCLKKWRRIRAVFMHLSKAGVVDKQMTIQDFLPTDPSNVFFEKDGKKISVAQYFKTAYPAISAEALQTYPVVKFTNGSIVPLTCISIVPDQRYLPKMDERETTAMLDFAVTVPPKRLAAIQENVRALNWGSDRYLQSYGLKVSEKPLFIKDARKLQCYPVVFGGNKTVQPRQIEDGRWRIDGFKFINPAWRKPTSWAIAIGHNFRGQACVTETDALRFAKSFSQIFTNHGCSGFSTRPYVFTGNLMNQASYKEIYEGCGNQNKAGIQFLFAIVGDKNADTYRAIKRQCDLNWGIASQVMQSKHVMKCQAQYISNICLKVNVKLGGATSSPSLQPLTKNFYGAEQSTIVLGADVSHAAPGSAAASIASLTMSLDFSFNRYMALCQSNGIRQEMVSQDAMKTMFGKMFANWVSNNKRPPKRIIYMRDGVATQQYYKVLTEEVAYLKQALEEFGKQKDAKYKAPPFTVLICTKRHHVRFFPQGGDRNGNPIPGTLVETGVTEATDLDWYLCSHVALKGTARPMHYTVILNECNIPPTALQAFLLENCFTYCRATTPVSMFPAIYYAHLAAARGKLHEADGERISESKFIETSAIKGHSAGRIATGVEQRREDEEAVPLLPLHNSLTQVMWYA